MHQLLGLPSSPHLKGQLSFSAWPTRGSLVSNRLPVLNGAESPHPVVIPPAQVKQEALLDRPATLQPTCPTAMWP